MMVWTSIHSSNCLLHLYSCAQDLQLHADHVPTVMAQLSVMASVKAATPDDTSVRPLQVKGRYCKLG